MVVTRIRYGLGNQMFQYAAGLALSRRLRCAHRLDTSYYAQSPVRTYQLNHFEIHAGIATRLELAVFKAKAAHPFVRRSLQFIRRLCPAYYPRIVSDESLAPDAPFFSVTGHVYLDGFFQNARFFEGARDTVVEEFRMEETLDEQNRQYATDIGSCDSSVMLHVRRDDLAWNEDTNRLFGVLGMDYYARAAEVVVRRVQNPRFFVFSDELEWARENIRLPYPVTFVAGNSQDKAYIDLHLMTLCHHHIIANSTLSWWGAYLGRGENKQVIAPRNWYSQPDHFSYSVAHDDWLLL